VISLQANNGLGYLGQGDSLKGIGNYNGALLSFSKAIEVDPKTISQGLMKRGLLFLQMKYSEQALQDFTKLTEIAEESNQPPTALSKAYFYKAKALKKMNNLNDAILYFE
jgi:tetratricopeptide (TPR) repeat protein